MTYKPMPGAEEDQRSNPAVRSKFDKSQGKGLPAPHLSHPGQTVAVTGTHHPGHNENGHKIPVEVTGRHGGDEMHKVTHHHPSTLGSGMAEGRGYAREPNIAQSDRVPEATRHEGMGPQPPRDQEQPSGHDRLHSEKQHDTRKANVRLGTEERAHQDRSHDGNKVTRSSRRDDAGSLSGNPKDRRGYSGGRGKI